MRKIDDIIRCALRTGEGVYLPWVGTLTPAYRAAVIENGKVAAPHRDITLTPEETEGAYSILDYIAREMSAERGEAERIYGRWFEESTADGVLRIDGVGRIAGGRLQLDAGFMTELNPDITGGIALSGRHKRNRRWIWIGGSAAAVCIVAVTLCYLAFIPQSETTATVTQKRAETEVVRRSATDSTPRQTAHAETPSTTNTTQAAGRPATADTIPAAVKATEDGRRDTQTARPAADRYYVVLGVFTDAANADKMTDKILKAKGDLEVNIETLPYGGKTMVTIYSGENEQEVTAHMRLLRSIHPDVWIYRRKAKR